MPDLDLEPHQYRRKATYRLRDMSWLVKLAVPLGILAPFLAAGVLSFFPPVPQWVAWGVVLAPCIVLVVLHEALDETRVKPAAETKDQLQLKQAQETRRAEDVSRDSHPK